MPLSRQARIVSAAIPASLQFRSAVMISRWQGRLIGSMGGNARLTEAMMRDHWLRELTVHGAFPIPWRLNGREVLDEFAARGPVMYYNAHLPLVELPLRVLMELGYPMPVPVADPGRIVDEDRYLIAGMARRVPALAASPHVLARMRTLLAKGKPVVCLADTQFGGDLLENPLRLTGRLRIPVLYGWAELADDRVIDVTFRAAPHPFCESEQAIAENMEFLRQIRDRLLSSLGMMAAVSGASVAIDGDPARVKA